MKIVLITTTQPAANPRLVKEATSLAAVGHDVTVLYNYVTDWAEKADKMIFETAKWKHRQIGGEKTSFIYKLSRFTFAFYKFINKQSGGKLFLERAQVRNYNLFLRAAAQLNADWYLAHNPGAMAIAANAAKKAGAKSGFDFEDYHRGEYADKLSSGTCRQMLSEKKYLKNFDFVTTASTLISEKINTENQDIKKPAITLLNCFPLGQQPPLKLSVDEGLNLFWFSQHLGKDRGLEIVIKAMTTLNDQSIHLTLAGNCSAALREYFSGLAGPLVNNIHFVGVIAPADLPEFSAEFDAGLALELSSPPNRDICLTNKIFTYLLAGNAVIFSETSAQKQFNNEYNSGLSFPIGDTGALAKCILTLKNKRILNKFKQHNYDLASRHLNWDAESQKFIRLFN